MKLFYSPNPGLTYLLDLSFKIASYSLQINGRGGAEREPNLPYYLTNTLIILKYHKQVSKTKAQDFGYNFFLSK